MGRAVVAVDIDPSFAAATARRFANNPKVECSKQTRNGSEYGSFDTIVMLDVLEHIEDDVGTLAALRGMLNEKGSIVLKIPALPQLYGALDAAIGHYRRYTRRSLAETAARANLVLAECRSFNLAAAPGWWLNGRILRRTNPPENQLRLYDRLVPAFRMVDRLTGPPFGTSLIAAARRNDVD
jgi:2-polyprenyl-3-methyl-5-hydroxy-6-metoxy-1,4-benzoquinol methylase